MWELKNEDCIAGMASLTSVDVIIDDPQYSEHVHKCSRRGNTGYKGDTSRSAISSNRDLGFDFLTPEHQDACSREYARLAKRWVMVFSDTESSHLWREALERHGLEYVRTLFWHKLGCTPQFTGDRPAVAMEAITLCKPPGEDEDESELEAITLCHRPGRKRWNGGGKHGYYPFPIVLNRGGSNPRLHTTQKPIGLIAALIEDFTEEGELVLDAHAGSGTTALAAVEAGRRFVGFELDPARHRVAIDRLVGAERQVKIPNLSAKMKQEGFQL